MDKLAALLRQAGALMLSYQQPKVYNKGDRKSVV